MMKYVGMLTAIEAWCADVIERAFAGAFPVTPEPVEIARKIVAAFESAAVPSGATIARVIARINSLDGMTLEAAFSDYEQRWAEMLARLAVRAGRRDRPVVTLESSAEQPRGVVAVSVEFSVGITATERAALALCVRRGVPLNACFPLTRSMLIGRDLECDIALVDPRVSRRHVHLSVDGERIRFTDLDSSNGTFLNGERQGSGELRAGDELRMGDTELAVIAGDASS